MYFVVLGLFALEKNVDVVPFAHTYEKSEVREVLLQILLQLLQDLCSFRSSDPCETFFGLRRNKISCQLAALLDDALPEL